MLLSRVLCCYVTHSSYNVIIHTHEVYTRIYAGGCLLCSAKKCIKIIILITQKKKYKRNIKFFDFICFSFPLLLLTVCVYVSHTFFLLYFISNL